jgi:hypothetical protein
LSNKKVQEVDYYKRALTMAEVNIKDLEEDLALAMVSKPIDPGIKSRNDDIIHYVSSVYGLLQAFIYLMPFFDRFSQQNGLMIDSMLTEMYKMGNKDISDLFHHIIFDIDPLPLYNDFRIIAAFRMFADKNKPFVDDTTKRIKHSKINVSQWVAFVESYKPNIDDIFYDTAEMFVQRKAKVWRALNPSKPVHFPRPKNVIDLIMNHEDPNLKLFLDSTPAKPVSDKPPSSPIPNTYIDDRSIDEQTKYNTPLRDEPGPPSGRTLFHDTIEGNKELQTAKTVQRSNETVMQVHSRIQSEHPRNNVNAQPSMAGSPDVVEVSNPHDGNGTTNVIVKVPKLKQRAPTLPSHFCITDMSKVTVFLSRLVSYCSQQQMGYLLDDDFYISWTDHGLLCLDYYVNPKTGQRLNLTVEQLDADVTCLYMWLFDILIETESAHIAANAIRNDGVRLYHDMVRTFNSQRNRLDRALRWKDLIAQPYRLNDSLQDYITNMRRNIANYNMEAERD